MYPIHMPDRRQFLTIVGVSIGLVPVVFWLDRVRAANTDVRTTGRFPLTRPDAEWRERLTPAQYAVLREAATERPYSSLLNGENRAGTYHCAACDLLLFSSASKYDSGTGWPSFWAAQHDAVGTSIDRGLLMVRTEVHCARCGGHLGHLFPDGPPPTGNRYCMNGVALTFVPEV